MRKYRFDKCEVSMLMSFWHNNQNFGKKVKSKKFITTALKNIIKLVKLQSLVVKSVVKCEKYNPLKFANFVHLCAAHELLPQQYYARSSIIQISGNNKMAEFDKYI